MEQGETPELRAPRELLEIVEFLQQGKKVADFSGMRSDNWIAAGGFALSSYLAKSRFFPSHYVTLNARMLFAKGRPELCQGILKHVSTMDDLTYSAAKECMDYFRSTEQWDIAIPIANSLKDVLRRERSPVVDSWQSPDKSPVAQSPPSVHPPAEKNCFLQTLVSPPAAFPPNNHAASSSSNGLKPTSDPILPSPTSTKSPDLPHASPTATTKSGGPISISPQHHEGLFENLRKPAMSAVALQAFWRPRNSIKDRFIPIHYNPTRNTFSPYARLPLIRKTSSSRQSNVVVGKAVKQPRPPLKYDRKGSKDANMQDNEKSRNGRLMSDEQHPSISHSANDEEPLFGYGLTSEAEIGGVDTVMSGRQVEVVVSVAERNKETTIATRKDTNDRHFQTRPILPSAPNTGETDGRNERHSVRDPHGPLGRANQGDLQTSDEGDGRDQVSCAKGTSTVSPRVKQKQTKNTRVEVESSEVGQQNNGGQGQGMPIGELY
ncbi:hypothetical protein QFC19_004524 [Naganishia cerealis]|uniref:Uncharacterized protein n=1 Tax=Naganishia cerealis TaxID=610337 RepID=A0ACC2VUF4_9TREE|nr:hypothetical protein QFC19_004524 [Naganishia cerealis]